MKLLSFLMNHQHYWGIPHTRSRDNKLVQTCYECGAEREIKIELREPEAEAITRPIHDDHIAA